LRLGNRVGRHIRAAKLAVQHAIAAAEKKPIAKMELTQASVITASTVSNVDLSGQECSK
jgi:hypothetical protein